MRLIPPSPLLFFYHDAVKGSGGVVDCSGGMWDGWFPGTRLAEMATPSMVRLKCPYHGGSVLCFIFLQVEHTREHRAGLEEVPGQEEPGESPDTHHVGWLSGSRSFDHRLPGLPNYKMITTFV